MKVIIQRVQQASVTAGNRTIGSIQKGYLLFVGFKKNDGHEQISYLVNKIANLRLFDDTKGHLGLTVFDVNGEVLSVSQFTLLANVKKGGVPNFSSAEEAKKAQVLFDTFNNELTRSGLKVQTGKFGEYMEVSLVNDGPITMELDTDELMSN